MVKNIDSPDKELLLRVKTIMVLRVVFLTGFVGLIFAFQVNTPYKTPIIYLSSVIAGGYFLSLSYAVILRYRLLNLITLSVAQIAGDLLVVGGVIFTTGGIESPLSFLYLFVIIATSVIHTRTATYLAASGASIIYGLLVDLEYFGVIQPVYFFPKAKISFQGAYGFYIIALNLASYYSVAFLSSILNHRLRIVKEELDLKSIDLEQLQKFHENVLQNMGNGLITTDLKGKITSINAASEEITGYNSEESVGRYCYDLLPLPALEKFFETDRSVALPMEIEGESKRKDGEPIIARMKISRLPEQETVVNGFICVFEDLTEIKSMEEKMFQAEQLAMVGKIAATLAHEIRNPLASLSGSIQVLKNKLSLKDEYARLMDIVLKETERLNAIVSDFLNYSQPRKNKNTVIDMTQLLEELVLLMKNSYANDSSIQIRLDAGNQHVIIQSDEEKIKQMIWNLSNNGIQAMAEGGTLRLSLKRVEQFQGEKYQSGRKGILITVEDEGKGIPPQEIKNIFDPFFTTRDEGVGLGLSNVFQFIEQAAGHIDVESELGKGTRFVIFLPQQRSLVPADDSEGEEDQFNNKISGERRSQ